MKSATIVCDPMSSRTSVQYGLVNLVIKSLKDYDSISVISPYIPESRINSLKKTATGRIISAARGKRFLHSFYKLYEKNESMLWAVSWLIESMFQANSSSVEKYIDNYRDETIINISYTVPLKCSLFWNQATPPLDTLKLMAKTNFFALLIVKIFSQLILLLDKKIQARHFSLSNKFVNNSRYLKKTYETYNHFSDAVIYVPKEFEPFDPPLNKPTRDYVLAYIGKETEVEPLLQLAKMGVRIVSFGAKIPFGTPLQDVRRYMDFRGFVKEDELQKLYFNALYTAFPFTEEPFGWVPLESMHFGTPVLTYNKQGPAETVLNETTGWLVNTQDEFVTKGVQLWESKSTNTFPDECHRQAMNFSIEKTKEKLSEILGGE